MAVEHLINGVLAPKPPKPRAEEEIAAGWRGDIKRPTLTICCIVYNHAEFIADALNSFLNQKTDFRFEIIVHDDASTDGSQEIIKKYQKDYPNIVKVIFQEENQYSKGRRALGFFQGLSGAPYLAICEGDDFWSDPQKLQKQVDYLDRHPECVITGHDAFIMDDAGIILSPSKLPNTQKRDWSGRELSEGKAWILTMSWVYRNVISEFAPERNMVRNGDTFFTAILGQYGSSHYHAEIQPAAYRVHGGGVWSSLDNEDKLDTQMNTWFWMYRYFKRVGEEDVSRIFLSKFKASAFKKSSGVELIKELIVRLTMIRVLKKVVLTLLGRSGVQQLKKFIGK
ncbi:glycosyltransferase [Alcanivorax sp. VBW004]|uniref:glycosyltransferase family 2 protein n=1 Tax=Alcanivorax sp. VBW004 TaxID=1287708 RepID=UPI0012BBCF87|nr:glycosyltransferase [Alcanivorax sp. VBW004]MTT52805.1 glycosyltransferase [Alcanivorax sp. VBW004]